MSAWPKTDFHLHATKYRLGENWPDMTVEHIVQRCEALGYTDIGIVEHLDKSPKHPVACLEGLVAEFRTVTSAMRISVGAELDIGDVEMSVPDTSRTKERLGLDYCLASVHSIGPDVVDIPSFVADHHRRTMLLVERYDPVDVIAHPWETGRALVRRGIADEWRFEFVPEAFLAELVDGLRTNGKAMELNAKAEAHFREAAFRDWMSKVRDAGVLVAIGSDAHRDERIGATIPQERFLREMGFGPEQLWLPGQR